MASEQEPRDGRGFHDVERSIEHDLSAPSFKPERKTIKDKLHRGLAKVVFWRIKY